MIFGCKKGCKSRNYLIYNPCREERGIGLALRAAHSLSTRRRALAELLQLVCRWHTRAVLYFFPRSSKLGWGKNKNSPALCAELHFCGERGIRTPGRFHVNGFQDRRIRPLCHLSNISSPKGNAKVCIKKFTSKFFENYFSFFSSFLDSAEKNFHLKRIK